MAGVIYGLCSLAAILCAALLFLGYTRNRYRLLLWGSLCFAGLTVNNLLVVMDELFVPMIDLSTWRLAAALGAMMILLYGLIWDTE